MNSVCASRAGSWKTRLRHWLLRLTGHMRSAHLSERMDAGARARWRLTYGSIDRCRLWAARVEGMSTKAFAVASVLAQWQCKRMLRRQFSQPCQRLNHKPPSIGQHILGRRQFLSGRLAIS